MSMTEHEFKQLVEAGIRDLMASRPIPYSNEGIAMIQKVVADVEASLTDEQRAARASRFAEMTLADWDAFVAAAIRPVRPEDLYDVTEHDEDDRVRREFESGSDAP